jgi:hypothetical protein
MPNYFFTDPNGIKQGPLTAQQLQTLVDRGVIEPETPLTTDSGHQGMAGQIPGLNFDVDAPLPFTRTSQYSPPRQSTAYSQANESAGTPWLFDFTFQDVRLPKNARRVCTFIYTCCAITLAINGLIGFFLLNPMYSPDTMTVALIFLAFYAISSFVFLVLVRVACELLIVLLDWIAENKKASRLYIKNNKEQ